MEKSNNQTKPFEIEKKRYELLAFILVEMSFNQKRF